jgi:hypothetical protein
MEEESDQHKFVRPLMADESESELSSSGKETTSSSQNSDSSTTSDPEASETVQQEEDRHYASEGSKSPNPQPKRTKKETSSKHSQGSVEEAWIIPVSISASAAVCISDIKPIKVVKGSQRWIAHWGLEADSSVASVMAGKQAAAVNIRIDSCPSTEHGQVKAREFVSWLLIFLSKVKLAGMSSEEERMAAWLAHGGTHLTQMVEDIEPLASGPDIPDATSFPFSHTIAKLWRHFSSQVEIQKLLHELMQTKQETRSGYDFARECQRKIRFIGHHDKSMELMQLSQVIKTGCNTIEMFNAVSKATARSSTSEELISQIRVLDLTLVAAKDSRFGSKVNAVSSEPAIATQSATSQGCKNCNYRMCKGDNTCRAIGQQCNKCRGIGHYAQKCTRPSPSGQGMPFRPGGSRPPTKSRFDKFASQREPLSAGPRRSTQPETSQTRSQATDSSADKGRSQKEVNTEK